MFRSQVAKAPHPVFAVDGQSLEIWLNEVYPQAEPLGLVPAQGWLINDDEFQWAWERISSIDPETSTIVPVLVCGDDVDLSCTVIVVEQESTERSVIWRRIGHSKSTGREAGIVTQWFREVESLEFERNEFIQALKDFKSLADNEWK